MGEGDITRDKWNENLRHSIRLKVNFYEVCFYYILFVIFSTIS